MICEPKLLKPSYRRPSEKLHERDLEAAITLSLLNNVDGIKDQSLTSAGKPQLVKYKCYLHTFVCKSFQLLILLNVFRRRQGSAASLWKHRSIITAPVQLQCE